MKIRVDILVLRYRALKVKNPRIIFKISPLLEHELYCPTHTHGKQTYLIRE